MRPSDPRKRFQTDGMQSVSQERLVTLLFERAARDIAEARTAITTAPTVPENRHRPLLHAQEIIEELAYAIRTDVWAGGENLLAIYDYILELLVRGNVDADLVALDDATRLVESLSETWSEAYVSLQVETAAT